MNDPKKISLPEIILVIMLSLVSELMDVIDLGWIIGFPIQFWIFSKGGGFSFKTQGPSLIGNILELIPIVDWLPIRTVTLIISISRINKQAAALTAVPAGGEIATSPVK